ncbi:MAG TPA: hypothetical protein VHK69_01820, partial [Chitinophagaceae bacterium]|nr:hypothetical protein [Chitinophagaceae bacterium]
GEKPTDPNPEKPPSDDPEKQIDPTVLKTVSKIRKKAKRPIIQRTTVQLSKKTNNPISVNFYFFSIILCMPGVRYSREPRH